MKKIKQRNNTPIQVAVELVPKPDRAMDFDVVLKRQDSTILKKAFQDGVAQSYDMSVRICAEGDSWCNLLWPYSGYPRTLVNWLAEKYYTNNIGWPGDTLTGIIGHKQYYQPVKSDSFHFFIFSAGGVDFFSELGNYLYRFEQIGEGGNPSEYIRPEFAYFLKTLKTRYVTISKQVIKWTTRTKMVIHGYDHAIPKRNGQFLGRRFEDLGYDTSDGLPARIVKHLIDEYYLALKEIRKTAPKRILLVDCRGACAGNWYDELHANNTGSKELARRFAKRMGIAF